MHSRILLFYSLRLEISKPFAVHFKRSLYDHTNMRVLNVAEKNDAAKNIASYLSRGAVVKREGKSKYNKIYEFDYVVFGRSAKMIMTSVKGHLFEDCFTTEFKHKWTSCNPILLFEAPVYKCVLSDNKPIQETLENEIRSCSKLIIWTDCDREGENIGFEIIKVCQAVRGDLEVYRAVFSEITPNSVRKALWNLEAPNKNISNAVDVRSELDLRIGAAFTRLQTIYLQQAFPGALNSNVISYGSCQFPTLGFVVDRFRAISEFKAEKFWEICVQHTINDLTVHFLWKRTKLFDKLACEVLHDKCSEAGIAVVENVVSQKKSKWRPKPLDTTELQKLTSRKFNITAKETLRVAENLYTKGLISYPRTETNLYSGDFDFASLVQMQTEDSRWGDFASKVLRDGPNPFQGNKCDGAHPPIHPIKHSNDLSGNEKTIYEIIVRSFLACISKHAEGVETVVDVDISGEKFSAKGLYITAKNYLEVYPYENWADKEIYRYQRGETFKPDISMKEGETSPPELLTEADLISLMEQHGIGTDATHADHIEKIKSRLYVGIQKDKFFVPRTLGMGLVEGYDSMGYPMAKPMMRAELEADLVKICKGQKTPRDVLETHIEKYKKLYEGVQEKIVHLAKAIQNYIQVEAAPVELKLFEESNKVVGKCPSCHSDLHLKKKVKGCGKYIGCSKFPECRIALWFPSFVLDVSLTEDTCPTCGPHQKLLRFKFGKGSFHYPSDHVGCVGGCDWNLLELLNSSSFNRKIPTLSDRPPPAEVAMPPQQQNINNGISITNSSSDQSPPKCFCSVPAVCLTVKKSGPNQGKEFYSCSLRGSRKCDFFMWKKTSDTLCHEGSAAPSGRKTFRGGFNSANNKTQSRPAKFDYFKWSDVDGDTYVNETDETDRGSTTLGKL